jgi:MYXO-CTERM domain-containing protein
LASVSAGAMALATPTPAEACGGTFCDAGMPMPVDQEGENILFVYEDGAIEVHIQIQYTGDPAKFGWVIPLQATPDRLEPGSEALFQNMLAATVPQYGFQTTQDECSADDGFGGLTGAPQDGGGTGAGGDETGGGGAEVLLQQQVGAFEITVLTAASGQEVATWLDDNEYLRDDESIPILDTYLAEGNVLAAVKLTDGAGVGEIHPIVFHFASDEPCVPLRLTRIAAVDDMEIRSFFLGASRTVPRTYRHVLVNPLKIDWPNFAANYKEAITLAVDAESADGRAFVTEYAGTSSVVSESGLVDPRWSSDAYRTLAAVDVMDTIKAQGLWACGFDPFEGIETCGFQHPLLQSLMGVYLPVPTGVTPEEFYDCLSCFEGQIDPMAWDANAFADDIEARIFGPGQRAADVLRAHPYLTRLYTTISPGEMTEDPMFWENPALPDVPNVNQAQQRILCNGDSIWTLPDGREVYLPSGTPWPNFDDIDGGLDDEPTQMPFAERIAEIPNDGAPMDLVDNKEIIDAKLAAWNRAQGYNGETPPEGGTPNGGSTSGCGCRAPNGGPGALWLLLLSAGVLVRRRRG